MRLVAMSGGQTLSFPLRQGSTLIGRHSSCHICIPAKTISRRHCQCYVDGTSVTLRDLGSSHGTFVNGQRVERAELHHGDVVALGSFELRFELTDGEAPAYGHGAGAAEDIVVTAQAPGGWGPAQGGPSGPQSEIGNRKSEIPPAGVEPPPPAPTDFPDRPSGEETPVDQSFMPAPYVPRQETVMGGAAGQPQLVVREGRWFLRDPRTGREVEIAPTGAEAGAAAARPAELRRPNTRLLVTVIAIAAIVVVAFAAVILRRPEQKVIAGPPVSQWVQLVDGAITQLGQREYAAAIAQLKLASGKWPDLEPARLLTQYALLLEGAAGDFLKLNRSEAKRYLESIENSRCPSEKALAYAREQRDWIDKESVGMGLYDAAMQRLGQVRESEDGLLEVKASLLQIPPNLQAAKLAKDAVADIDKTVATGRLSRAAREKAQLKWAEAVTQYQEALPFVASAPQKAQIQKEMDECRRYAAEAEIMRQAQKAINDKTYGSAEEALKRIKPGYYHDNAQRLLADIQRMKAAEARDAIRQQIESLYRSGAGPQAAELAKKNNFPEFDYIAERAKRVEDLLAAGKKAEDDHEYRDAEDKYQEAVGVEADANNDYRRRAERALKALKDSYPQISEHYCNLAYRLMDKDPAQARKNLDLALKYDANNERAKKGLETLDRNARRLYSEGRGYMMRTPKQPAHAKPAFERALQCAEPGSNLYQLIVQELEKLKEEE